jgi:hypothetical protein
VVKRKQHSPTASQDESKSIVIPRPRPSGDSLKNNETSESRSQAPSRPSELKPVDGEKPKETKTKDVMIPAPIKPTEPPTKSIAPIKPDGKISESKPSASKSDAKGSDSKTPPIKPDIKVSEPKPSQSASKSPTDVKPKPSEPPKSMGAVKVPTVEVTESTPLPQNKFSSTEKLLPESPEASPKPGQKVEGVATIKRQPKTGWL